MNDGARALRWLGRLLAAAIVAVIAHHPAASAHEARPAYLELTETLPDRYDVVWRTPVLAGLRLPVLLQFPDGVNNLVEPTVREFSDSIVERRIITAPGGLGGKRIEFVGLQGTITDVLVRIQTRDGERSTILVHPSRPWVEIAATPLASTVATAYLAHGIEHILLGYDHLLFVLALILIVRNLRVLLVTVTAFTLAHSITLALATLGVVHVPGPPVEAAIALSIVLLACEIRARRRVNWVSRRAGPGWWRSRSASCTASVSPVRSPTSVCRQATFRSRCSRSMSESRSVNSPSSQPCSPH